MKIFADENIPGITLQKLREIGHSVTDIRRTVDQGMSDNSLWERAQKEKALFVTTDAGFIHHRNEEHYGILIVRLKKPNRHKIHTRIMKALMRFGPKEWPGLLVVVQGQVQRIWKTKHFKK